MLDRDALEKEVRSRLAPLEPLRRRVVRVYWMRGLLVLLTLAAAAGLGLLASLAAALWVARATGGTQGELVLRIVPLLLAFLVPLGLIAGAAGFVLAAILKRFGRRTVLEHARRFREEVVAPALRGAAPGAELELLGHVDGARLFTSPLAPAGQERIVSGALLMRGRAGGAEFAVSTLELRSRGRLGRGRWLFRGLFASIEGVDCSVASPAAVATLLLELERQLGAPLVISRHAAGVTIALPLPRAPFQPSRVRPSDARQIAGQTAFYGLVAETASALAALAR